MTHQTIAYLRYVCLLFFSILKVLKCRFWGHFLIKYSTNWRVGINLLNSSKHCKHGSLPQAGNPKARRLTWLMHIAQLRLKFVVYLCSQWYHNAHLSEFIFLCITVYNKRIPTSRFSKVLLNFADELLTASLQITVYGSSGLMPFI